MICKRLVMDTSDILVEYFKTCDVSHDIGTTTFETIPVLRTTTLLSSHHGASGRTFKYCTVASSCTLQFIINLITTVLSATIPQPKSFKHF
jgi:hypothetical protein